jgi:hypothetical protein
MTLADAGAGLARNLVQSLTHNRGGRLSAPVRTKMKHISLNQSFSYDHKVEQQRRSACAQVPRQIHRLVRKPDATGTDPDLPCDSCTFASKWSFESCFHRRIHRKAGNEDSVWGEVELNTSVHRYYAHEPTFGSVVAPSPSAGVSPAPAKDAAPPGVSCLFLPEWNTPILETAEKQMARRNTTSAHA